MLRKAVSLLFAILAVAFLARGIQYGYLWMSGASSPEANYKALTAWSGVYLVVCGALAWVVARLRTDSAVDGE
jgi:hypothetical protein